MSEATNRTVIVGAGPAGLTAALHLAKESHPAIVLEADTVVGGISRSVEFKGNRMDIGGHRFFTKVPEIEALWHEILGDDLLVRERMSRIFYRGSFFDYPLKPANALRGLGLVEAVRIVTSYAKAQVFPAVDELTFDAWVSNRFGRRLFEVFFKTYTEKVWGMPCSEISAAWAAQRIKNLDLMAAVKNAFVYSGKSKGEVIASLIDRFLYPRLGPGMMWERCQEMAAERGVETQLGAKVCRMIRNESQVVAVEIERRDGSRQKVDCSSVISSMPIGELVRAMSPEAPPAVRRAADGLRYRDFLIIGLLVGRPSLFPDNWIYIHSPNVKVGRVQNFKNWSPEMVRDPETSFVGLEYFVNCGDELWSMGDEELIELGAREAHEIGLFDTSEVVDGIVVRMPKAYPVYDGDYLKHVHVIRGWLSGLDNLSTVGRNGQHRYNNQDHSMLAGLFAARKVLGEDLDLWAINEDQSYQEEVRSDDAPAPEVSDRRIPTSAPDRVARLIRSAFSRYDPVALGAAVGITASCLLTVITVVALIGPADDEFVPMLSLLGNYFFGFRVSWQGLAVGLAEAAAGGFILGWVTARMLNSVVRVFENGLRRRLEMVSTIDSLEGPRT